MAGEELSARADLLSQTYRDAGVTFAHAGEEQPFPLDIVPRVIGAEEWDVVERGVAQRVNALEAFLADVYGAGQVFADRVVPRNVVTTSAHFHRQAHGLVPPNGVRVHVSGIDLVRDEAGDFRVLEDNLRSPSGVSYVITNFTQAAPLNNTIGFLQNGDNAAGNNYTGYFLYARATANVL